MSLDWAPLVELIRRHQTFLLMTHVRPDADGLGSQLALYGALRAIGKSPRVAIASKLPRVQALFAVGSSYARSMAFSAATVFALGAVVALLGRERRGVAFGTGPRS